MSLLRPLLTCLLLLGMAFGVRSQVTPAAPDPTCHFLIAIETSIAMGKRADAMRKTVGDLIATGIYGHMKPGQKLAIWTFDERVYPNRFAMISWEPGLNRSLALNTVTALKRHPFVRTAQLDTLMREIQVFARAQKVLNVIVVTEGGQIMYGTPFDRRINLFYGKNYESFRKSGVPFVTTLVLKDGEFEAWSINAGDDKVFIPPLDEPVKMAKETPTAPPRPGANLEIVTPPAVTNNAPLPPIVITYAPNTPPKIEASPVAEAPKPTPAPTPPPTSAPIKSVPEETKKVEIPRATAAPPSAPPQSKPTPPPAPATVTATAPASVPATAVSKPETVTSTQIKTPEPAQPIALPSASISTTSSTPPAIRSTPAEAPVENSQPAALPKTEAAAMITSLPAHPVPPAATLTPPPPATPVVPAASISTSTKTAPTVTVEKPAPKKDPVPKATKSAALTPLPPKPVDTKAAEKSAPPPPAPAASAKTNAPETVLPSPQTAVVLTPPATNTRWSFLGAGFGLLVIAGGLVYFMMRARPVKAKPSLISKFVDNDKK